MKMHNWIFKHGTSFDIVNELSRITNCPAEPLVEAAAFIANYRPIDVRLALGNAVWANGVFSNVDSDEPCSRLEVWMSTEYGDHLITVDI